MYARMAFFEDHDPAQIDELIRRLEERSRHHAEVLPESKAFLAFVDRESDEQFEALSRIWRGEEGYSLYEIFNSTLDEPTGVDRARIELTVDGKSSRVVIEGIAEAVMTPLRSPVSGEGNDVRIVKDGGFIWADGEIATNERMKVDAPEVKFDLAGRHSVFAPFAYGN